MQEVDVSVANYVQPIRQDIILGPKDCAIWLDDGSVPAFGANVDPPNSPTVGLKQAKVRRMH